MLLAKSTFYSVKAGFPPKLCYLHETTQLVNISLVSALSEVSGSTSLGKNKESFNIKLKLAPAHSTFMELPASDKVRKGWSNEGIKWRSYWGMEAWTPVCKTSNLKRGKWLSG